MTLEEIYGVIGLAERKVILEGIDPQRSTAYSEGDEKKFVALTYAREGAIVMAHMIRDMLLEFQERSN